MDQGADDTDASVSKDGTYKLRSNLSDNTSDGQTVVTSQPTPERSTRPKLGPTPSTVNFDDAHCERNWKYKLCECNKSENHCCYTYCCWCYQKYMLATRLGETPFMALIPCATFALRIKSRTLFGIKGSLLKDFCIAQCCEPCAICQMTAELDDIGL